jgi:hypothetical protein
VTGHSRKRKNLQVGGREMEKAKRRTQNLAGISRK